MTNTMLNEGEAVSRGAMGRQRNPNFSLPIDGAQAQQLMQDLGDEPSMLDEARLDLLEGYTGQVRNQKARDMRSMYTDPVTWWKGEGNDNVADEVKHEIANRRFIANAFGQTTDQQGDLYPSFRDRYFDQTFGKMPANESEAFTMLQKGVTAQQQTEQAIKELPSTLALNLMRAAAGGTEVSEAASYDIYQSWKDRHADVLASLPEDWESKAMEQAETLRSEMDTMMRDIAPEAKKVWDILQKWTRPEKTYTGDKPPEGQGRGPSQQDTSVANDTPVSREDVEGVAKALTEMPEEKQKRLLEMLYMSAEATGAGMGRGFFEKIGEGLVRGGVRIYEEGVMASEDRTARYNLTRLKRGETLYEMADGVVGTKEEIARLASSGNYNATKLLTDPSFQAGTGNVNDERRSQLLDANEQRLRELSTLRKIRGLAEGGIDPLKTEMTGIAGSVVQGAYDYSQSAGYTVMAAVPFVGFPAVTISLANSNYLRMLDEYPDIDPDFAWNASLAIGAPQAFIERFKVNALMGRSPMLNKLMKRMTDARVPLGVRIGLAYGANVAYQTGQEFLQEAMPTVADQLSAALREDMPEFDANQAWGAYVDQMPQIFYSMLWAGLIGTGAVSLREFKRDGIFLTNVGELEMVGIVGDTARDIAAEQDTDARNEKIKTAWGQRSEADIKAGIAKRAAMLQAANVNDTRAGMPQRDSVELQDGTVQHTIRDSEGNVLLKTTDPLAADVAYIGMVRQITSKEFNNETVQLKGLTEWWLNADPTRADNEQRQLRDTDQGNAQQKLEALQQANNEQGIAELHRRIAQSPYAGTPYDQIQILGEASVEQVGDMVFRSVIALNKNSRVRDAREEMHHTAVRMAVANGKVDEQTMRGWLEATERVFAEKGLNTPLPRADMTDIVESMAVVQEAFENERISADVEMSLPQAFVDYIKRMIQVLVEVLKRGKAIREALDAGVLPAEFEGFLAMTTGVSQQEIVDRARERTEQEVGGEPAVANYSIGALGDDNPFIHPRGADGKYKGAPKWVNAPKTRRGKDEAYMRLRERLYQLVQEGAAGRFWYEDSGRAVLRMFNNNVVEAEKFIELLAIYSPQATVEVNTYFALRAYIQRAVNAAKEDFAVKTGAQDDKAKSVLYDNQPWAGRKTDNFYKNIMYVLLKELPASEVAKLKLDAEVYEMLQKPVTVDMWVYRAFGFDSDALTDVAGTGAFGFAERELNLIAEELNASLPEGAAPYLPHQIQAMLWTSIKGRSETKEVKDLTEAQSMKAKDMVKVKNAQGKLVREFKDKEAQKRHMQRWITNALALPAEKLDVGMAAGAFDRFINSVSMRALWESVPSTNTPEGVAITNLSTAQKAAFTRASRDIILDENGNDMLAAMLGVPVNVSQLLSGGYGTGATPNVVTELFPNKPSGTYNDDVVRAYARAIQYIYRQDAVPWMRYIKYGAENDKSYYAESPKGAKRRFATQAEAEAYAAEKEGYVVKGDAENFAVRLDFGEQLTPDFLDQLQQGLVKVHESLGFTQVSPTQVIVTNFRDSQTGLPALTDEQFSERIQVEYGEQADIQRLFTVGEYGPVHNWSADQTGEGLLSANSSFGPDLLEWLRGRRAVSDALQKDWAEGRGVVSNYSIGSTGVTLAEQLKELQAGESAPVDTDKTFWLIASSSGDIVDILDNEQDATIYFQTTASTSEWLWEYKDGLRTKVPLLKRGVAERRADGYIDTVRQEQENAGRVFYDGADTSAETATSAGEIPSYTPDGQPWAGQEESVVYHGGRLFDPQGTDQGGYGETQTLKPRRPYQTYLYSISTQSEIDRVQKAMDRLARSPSERISQYAALKERLAAALERNQPIMQSMRGDTLPQDFDRSRILNDLGFLDYILKVLPPEVRGRVGGYTNLAAIAPVDVYKGDQKVSETKNPAGAIISAWMREGQNIGQAQKNTALPEGYSTVANTTDERRDKTVANFLIDRLKKIDRELERYYKRDLMERIFDVLDKSRPKAGQSGVKRSTLGAETQKFADMVYRASLLDDEQTAERLAAIEAAITSTESSQDSQKRISELSEEWTIVNTFGDLKNRPSETMAYGLEWLQGQLKAGREAWNIKETARIEENRQRVADALVILGKPTDKGRFENPTALKRFLQSINALDLDHKSFEQFATIIFGDKLGGYFSEKLRQADISAAKAELENTKKILNALREGAKAAGTSTGKALVKFKREESNVIRKLEGRKVKNTEIAIDLAKKIVRGLADRGSLSQADVQTLADELASLPRDTKKQYVTIKQVIYRGDETRISMNRATAMQLWLSWQQSDIQEKMRREGWNDDSAEDLENLLSDPVSQAILKVTRSVYGGGYALTNPIYSRMFGMNMPMVKNYAPARFLNAKEVKDVSLDGSPLTAGGQPSFAKSRVTHSAKIANKDGLAVLQQHIAQQAHWVSFAELTREYRSLLSNPEVRDAITQRYGEDVLTTADMWAEQMEQRGGNKGREIAWINNMLGAAIGGQSVSLLGFNLKSLMMQSDNLMRFALALDSRQIASAMSDPAGLMRAIRKVWETDLLQTRLGGGATAETRFLFNRFVSMFRRGAKISELAMMPMNYVDSAGLSISGAIVYQAAYKDAVESGMTEQMADQAAKDAVEAMIYRYGQPVLMGQKSNIENSGNVFAKTFFLFMSDPRLKTALLADSIRGLATGSGNWKDHVRRIVAVEMMAIVSHVLATAFRDATSDDDDEDLWSMGGFARALLLAPLQGYFLVGSVSEVVLSRLTEARWFTPTQNPFIRTADTAFKAFNNLDDAFNFDDPDALVKEWTNITRSIALTPPLAAPAVIMNLVRPLVQAWERMDDDE